jgi:hypothetical protein
MLNKIAGNNNNNLCKGWSMIRPNGLGSITQPCTISDKNVRNLITCPWSETKIKENKA